MGLHAWDEMLDLFFGEKGASKIEWAIGSVLSGGPEKFLVISGKPASGKSTVLHIVEEILNHRGEVRHYGFESIGADRDGFKVVTDNSSMVFMTHNKMTDHPKAIHVQSTGAVIPFENYGTLVDTAKAAHEEIAKQCIYRYQTLGANYFNQQENN